MEKLLSYFLHAGFTPDNAATIAESFSFKKLKKGEFFVKEASTNKYLGFIEKGFLQYFIIIDGEEKTTYSAGIIISLPHWQVF